MHQDNSLKLFTKVYKVIGKRWEEFIDELKSNSDIDDQSQLFYVDFVKILRKYGAPISENEMLAIAKAFPGKQGGEKGIRLNVSRLYDQKFNIIQEKLYNSVDCMKIDADASLKDVNGYLGKTEHYRDKIVLVPITESEFFKVLHANNKLREIMLMVREIDGDHNGYITYQELDDIIKL
jgi:Ca2+-binding EF-hand superfamily protein